MPKTISDWHVLEEGCYCPHCKKFFEKEWIFNYLKEQCLPEWCVPCDCPECGSDMHVRTLEVTIEVVDGTFKVAER